MTKPIHYEVYGSGREIIICNGLSQSTANWRGIARKNSQFRWILFDARGHGKSQIRKRPYCIDDHVQDLEYVLKHTEAKKPLLMGFSHGARIALRAAATHPDWFCGLVIVSCGSKMTPRRRAHVTSWEQSLHLGGVRGLAWCSLPTIVGTKILEQFNDLEFLIKASVARNNEEGLKAVFEGMKTYPPAKDDAEKITLPTTVFHGSQDLLVPDEDLQDFLNWIPQAKGITYAESGHTLSLEEPDRFLGDVSAFYDSIDPE